MGDLPKERITPEKVFNSTGIDLCGPFFIKNKYQRKGPEIKVYVCIFICLVTKAIHLEIISDLTSQALIAALKRFISRRGNSKFSYEELLTLITQIEAILNSRPLTPLSSDVDDLEVLTPAHFLIGRPITAIVEPSLLQCESNRLNVWQRITKSVQTIWKRWSLSYLNSLQQRKKWIVNKENLKLGDMVLIREENLPPCKWLLGRVVKIYMGKDKKVRVVDIKTGKVGKTWSVILLKLVTLTNMDDIVSGAPDLETAQQLQSQLKDALQSCGMNLHKWSSNSPELLNSSLSSDVEHSFSTDIDLSVKTLGISWKPFEDCFVFKQLWQCKLDWDDVLPNSIANEWREFVTTLKCIEEVKINRFIMADNNVRIVLQGFADASEAAYGAVVYLQCFLHNGAAKVSILASKSRVAPIRVISIPRLELCACVLLAQLVKKIRSTLRLNISDIVLHTDSTIALAWLNTPANRLKTFVANRVAKVQELTEGFQWNHVPSVLNPADLVSRGLRPCDLPNLRLWWHGPQFLEKDIDQAETKLIRMVQEQVFLAEIKSLQSKGVVSPNSKLRNLNPFIDSDGLLRV
ncbi:integrase catalytic domain-containing protein [Trichonephila clavipes]|nr:integrase catalytic domain-containing protein [Trichonephila clavipes]